MSMHPADRLESLARILRKHLEPRYGERYIVTYHVGGHESAEGNYPIVTLGVYVLDPWTQVVDMAEYDEPDRAVRRLLVRVHEWLRVGRSLGPANDGHDAPELEATP